ncbi:MAG: hypothetical protein QM497_09795 [Sulfurimonas sp.]
MKKLFLLFLLITSGHANSLENTKANIILELGHIVTNNKVIKIYNTDSYFKNIFKENTQLQEVTDYKKADLILTQDSSNFSKNSNLNIISTRYRDYKKYKKRDIGAFFWQKGRPNILLNRNSLARRNIKIQETYRKYLD